MNLSYFDLYIHYVRISKECQGTLKEMKPVKKKQTNFIENTR